MTKKIISKQDLLKAIPKVDEFLGWIKEEQGETVIARKIMLLAVRETLEEQRSLIMAGEVTDTVSLERHNLLEKYRQRLSERLTPNFRTVINATGVVVHTNMGRSILPDDAMQHLIDVGSSYSNLEFDLQSGKRGSRYSLVEDMLCELTGAEAALVVNNNAAAVLLVLDTIAKGREVVVSRGQLVEIGGSFRIPDVMEKSGAILKEVGATNRTHLRDYESAIGEDTALLLKVHTSNFKVIGFTSEVALEEMVVLGGQHSVPVMEDLGSGCFVDLSTVGLHKEPTVSEVIASGVDVVTFSGDKLLGGPQAGLILGRKEMISTIKKNPLNRALRIDKFTLAGLESILRNYYDERQAFKSIPTLAMLAELPAQIKKRARRLVRKLPKEPDFKCRVRVVPSESRVGGGALPEQALPTWAVELTPQDRSVVGLEKSLRSAQTPIIGRIENDCCLLDMRTVLDGDITLLAESLCRIFED